MATDTQKVIRLSGLGRRIVEEGLLDEATLLEANSNATEKGQTLAAFLLRNNLVDPHALAYVESTEFGVPLLDINAIDLSQAPITLVPENLITKHHAVPLFKRGKQLFVALPDPTNHTALDEIAFSSNLIVEPVLVPVDQLDAAIERALSQSTTEFDDFGDDEGLEDVEFAVEEDEKNDTSVDTALDDTPVVKFVNKVLLDAIRKGASDIHFEPYEKRFRVRYRLDGVLKGVASPPVQMSRRLVSRLKVMSGLDIAERRVPQDGRIKLNLSRNKSIDFRVSTCPTLFGEKVVLRILDPAATKLGIDQLGYEEHQKDLFVNAILKPYGMVLVTGPTGSGKTVSLYTALNILNTEGRNISTVEDPVEIRVGGINQVQQNTKQGMTFARALRAFLRQDPDVIMVGEIRDLETAEIAIKAAQTGHMVLSTLHTNDAPQAVTRMMNMGVANFNITSAVSLVIAQRLARRLHDCKVEDELPPEALLEAGFTQDEVDEGFTVYKPVGCSGCNEGYKGRTGIFQVMPISEEMAKIILAGGNALQLNAQAQQEGIIDLRRSALNKVREGITGLVEINRVTKD